MHNKRVLITGATGFIGLHCLRHLQNCGYDIYASCNSSSAKQETRSKDTSVNWIKADLMNRSQVLQLIKESNPELLLHLAWYAEPKKFWNSEVNLHWISASLNLVEAFCENNGKRVLVTGTCAEYESNLQECDEELSPCVGNTLYGVSKHALFQVLSSYLKTRSVEFIWARIFNLFGPYEKEGRLASDIITSLLNELPFKCTNPDAIIDLLHVDDVADALITVLNSNLTGALNISAGNQIPVIEFANLIGDILDRRRLIQRAPINQNPSLVQTPIAKKGRLQSELNWLPKYTIQEAIKNSVDYWKGIV